ncbi:MAG: hypothetical protein IPH13_15065 [Planctomycetes bacterium]|nr:hypothetical protein [Planctomycetota bacterium]
MVVAPAVPAQAVIRKHWGIFPQAGPSKVQGMDDVDGDAVGDYMIARPPSAGSTDRVIKVYSGASGQQLYGIPEAVASSGFGSVLDGGFDATGDGIGDILAGLPKTPLANGTLASYGSVRIYSGVDGLLYREQAGPMLPDDGFGWAVRWVGDLDGDSRSEYAVTEIQPSQTGGAPRLWVFSGATGATVSVSTSNVKDGYGFALDLTDDVDGDGTPEILASAPGHAVGGVASVGAVFVVNPRTGSILNTVPGSSQLVLGIFPEVFGWTVASVGDLTGDGLPEIAAGRGGYGIRISGVMTGTTIAEITAPKLVTNVLGGQLETTDDLDGDGHQSRFTSIWSIPLGEPRGLLVISPPPEHGLRCVQIRTAASRKCSTTSRSQSRRWETWTATVDVSARLRTQLLASRESTRPASSKSSTSRPWRRTHRF